MICKKTPISSHVFSKKCRSVSSKSRFLICCSCEFPRRLVAEAERKNEAAQIKALTSVVRWEMQDHSYIFTVLMLLCLGSNICIKFRSWITSMEPRQAQTLLAPHETMQRSCYKNSPWPRENVHIVNLRTIWTRHQILKVGSAHLETWSEESLKT